MKPFLALILLLACVAQAQLTNPTVYAPSLPLVYHSHMETNLVTVISSSTNSTVNSVSSDGTTRLKTEIVTTIFAVDIPGHGRATNQVTRTNCITLKLKWVEEK